MGSFYRGDKSQIKLEPRDRLGGEGVGRHLGFKKKYGKETRKQLIRTA